MKKVTLPWFLVLVIVVLQNCSNGDVVSYTLDITSGGAHTSGGYFGDGIGDLVADGIFKLIINYDTGYADLEDIDISLTSSSLPGYSFPSGFDWSSLEGTLSSGNLYLSSSGFIPTIDNYLSGSFNGHAAHLQGTVYDDYYDGFVYDCTINAVVIPEPTTLLLLSLGGLALSRNRKR